MDFAIRGLLTLGIFLVGSLLMIVVAIPTLFLARRFYSEVIACWLGRLVLRLWKINYATHYSDALPNRQTIYISNHTSTLDVLLLISLGLPRTRQHRRRPRPRLRGRSSRAPTTARRF